MTSIAAIISITIIAIIVTAYFSIVEDLGSTVVVTGSAVVVTGMVVVGTVVAEGAIFWKIPTIGSFGTTNDTVHAVAFTRNGVIAVHVPLTSLRRDLNPRPSALWHPNAGIYHADALPC